MEMHKTLCMLLRLFRTTREAEGPTKLQEGFFLKAVECRVKLEKRPQITNEYVGHKQSRLDIPG